MTVSDTTVVRTWFGKPLGVTTKPGVEVPGLVVLAPIGITVTVEVRSASPPLLVTATPKWIPLLTRSFNSLTRPDEPSKTFVVAADAAPRKTRRAGRSFIVHRFGWRIS